MGSHRPNLVAALLGFTAAVAFTVAVLALAMLVYGFYHRDVIYPGVSVAGQDVGGMNRSEALAAIDGRTSGFLQPGVTFASGEQTWVVDAEQLGVRYDAQQSIDAAFAIGRTGNWWVDSREWLKTFIIGRDVGYAVTLDDAAIQSFLASVSSEISVRPQNPRYEVTESGELQIIPGTAGTGIDLTSTLRGIRTHLLALDPAPIPIVSAEVSPSMSEAVFETLHADVQAIVGEALYIKHAGYGWLIDPITLYSLLVIDFETEGGSGIQVDSAALTSMLNTLAPSVQTTGTSARVDRDGDQFVVVPSRPGHVLDLETSSIQVESAILSRQHEVTLVTTETPAVVGDDAARVAADRANEILGSTFELRYERGVVLLAGDQLIPAINFETVVEEGAIEVRLDQELLEVLLAPVAHEVQEAPVNAELRYSNGEVVVARHEELGLSLDREVSAERLAASILGGDTEVTLATIDVQPDVTAAMAPDVVIRELISFGETYYPGSAANRKHNVELATSRANGALVPPGGEYSFVSTIGDISLETGYQLGFGIEGTTDGNVTTVPSVGGGACQVSTTIYQAAFWAGLPIVERNWHLYWLPLYGQPPTGITGLDATIDTSWGLDFRFTNTTGEWLAIVATADGNAVRFEIWGTKPDWQVEVDGPIISNRVPADRNGVVEETDRLPAGTRLQVETAQDGFDVLIKRRVFENGELIDEIDLFSSYRPASNRTLVGTGR
jgi:vancomycin resistance protein YoaR